MSLRRYFLAPRNHHSAACHMLYSCRNRQRNRYTRQYHGRRNCALIAIYRLIFCLYVAHLMQFVAMNLLCGVSTVFPHTRKIMMLKIYQSEMKVIFMSQSIILRWCFWVKCDRRLMRPMMIGHLRGRHAVKMTDERRRRAGGIRRRGNESSRRHHHICRRRRYRRCRQLLTTLFVE